MKDDPFGDLTRSIDTQIDHLYAPEDPALRRKAEAAYPANPRAQMEEYHRLLDVKLRHPWQAFFSKLLGR